MDAIATPTPTQRDAELAGPARVAFRFGDRRLFARIICALRGGDSAHCEVAGAWAEDGTYECVSASWLDGGVRGKRMPLPAAKWRIYELASPNSPAAWLHSRAGAGYDLLGLLGIVFPPVGQSRQRWFCSEAVADVLGLSEPHIFDLRTLESTCARFGRRVQ